PWPWSALALPETLNTPPSRSSITLGAVWPSSEPSPDQSIVPMFRIVRPSNRCGLVPLIVRFAFFAIVVTPPSPIAPPLQSYFPPAVSAASPPSGPPVCTDGLTEVPLETTFSGGVFSVAMSVAPGTPLSRPQFSGLNQLVSTPAPASQTKFV